jgi:hypothetical protein
VLSNVGTAPQQGAEGGLRVRTKGRLGRFDVEEMDAAYSDVRIVANQLEDQLTRAFEVRAACGGWDGHARATL